MASSYESFPISSLWKFNCTHSPWAKILNYANDNSKLKNSTAKYCIKIWKFQTKRTKFKEKETGKLESSENWEVGGRTRYKGIGSKTMSTSLYMHADKKKGSSLLLGGPVQLICVIIWILQWNGPFLSLKDGSFGF